MCDESDHNELMDAVLLELQIQICVGEAAGTPMLRGDDLAWLRLELGTDLAAPRAVFEDLALPRCLLNGRNVLPSLVVAGTVSMMHCIEDPKLRLPRGIQDLQHMRNAVIRFCNSLNAVPYLASLGDDDVIRIDHQKRNDLLVICGSRHGVSSVRAVGLSVQCLGIKKTAKPHVAFPKDLQPKASNRKIAKTWHKSQALKVPSNISLMPLPPRSPGIPRKTSGSSCATIGCQAASSNPSTISSTTAAMPGIR